MERTHDVPRLTEPVHPRWWPRWWLLPYRALGIALAVFAAYLLLAKVAGAIHRYQGAVILLAAVLGVAGALYWTWREPRIDSVRLQGVLEILVRYALGCIFISYGMAKLFRTQFSPASFFQLEQPVGDLAGIDLTWIGDFLELHPNPLAGRLDGAPVRIELKRLRRHAPFPCLLEGVRQRDQPGLAAGWAGEADPKG